MDNNKFYIVYERGGESLPVFYADSIHDLADYFGKSTQAIYNAMSRIRRSPHSSIENSKGQLFTLSAWRIKKSGKIVKDKL